METVCEGKQWDVIISKGHGNICGTMPFLYGRKFGLKYILQPQLTPWCGPWVKDKDEKLRYYTIAALAAAMQRQRTALFMQCLPPGTTDWQQFYDNGFSHTTRHTYRFDPIPEPERLPELADRGRKRNVETVRQAYTIDKQVNADEFAALHTEYWERKSGHDLIDRTLIQRVCTTALSRRQALLYGLRDEKGTLMAARFVVYDSNCAYALMSGMRPDALRNSMTVLVWEMLTDLYGRTKAFDFEGGSDPGVGHFYSSFGAKTADFICIYRPRLPFAKKLLHL